MFRLLELLGAAYGAQRKRFRIYPAHPPFVAACQRKAAVWRQVADGARSVELGSSSRSGSSTVKAAELGLATGQWIRMLAMREVKKANK